MSQSRDLQDFINSAILGGLGKYFDIHFTDSVFDHADYYTSIPEVLETMGYLVQRQPKIGVIVVGNGQEFTLTFGTINSVFLNDFAQYSLGASNLTGYPVEFDQSRDKAGKLGNFSPLVAKHFKELDVTPAQADPSVVSFFQSDEVVNNPNPGSIYIYTRKQADNVEDFCIFDDNGRLQIVLPDEPGYWKVELGAPTGAGGTNSSYRLWEKALVQRGFSFRFFISTGHLYFSNTKGAAFGLPPRAKHMRWEKLKLLPVPCEEDKPVDDIPPEEGWKQVINRFKDDPTWDSFVEVMKDPSVLAAASYYRSRHPIRIGVRDIGRKVRGLLGYHNAIPVAKYAEFLAQCSFPDGLEYYLVNFVNIGNGIRRDLAGNVYVQ